MFGDQFYPTPSNLIIDMWYGLPETVRTVDALAGLTALEPSAGKGDITKFLVEKGVRNIHVCEIDPNLQKICTAPVEVYRRIATTPLLVGSDFLALDATIRYGLIMMNPPFRAGVDHLLKAWDILAPGGALVCLLNATSLNEPRVARLIEQHGRSKLYPNAFAQAERAAKVDVAMIWLTKPAPRTENIFAGVRFDEAGYAAPEAAPETGIMSANRVQALVETYNAALASMQAMQEARQVVIERCKLIGYNPFEALGDSRQADERIGNTWDVDELMKLRRAFWQSIFKATHIGDVVPSSVREDFEATQQRTQFMDFTVANIQRVLQTFLDNRNQIMTNSLVSVFDQACEYHASNSNLPQHIKRASGWISNEPCMLGDRIVMPRGIRHDSRWGFDMAYGRDIEFFTDLDKVCCLLAGKVYQRRFRNDGKTDDEFVPIEYAMDKHIHERKADWDSVFESTFFHIRIFKIGTVHLTWKKEYTWVRDKINLEVNRVRGATLQPPTASKQKQARTKTNARRQQVTP